MSQFSLSIHMEPNAKQNEVGGIVQGYLRLKIAVKPDDENLEFGNKEIVAFMSEILGISSDRVSVTHGKELRFKVLGIEGMDARQVMEKLQPHMKS